jgi:hypothetical protein
MFELAALLHKDIYNSMAKTYSKKTSASKNRKPSKETISFLLSYSKALSVMKIDNRIFEIMSN